LLASSSTHFATLGTFLASTRSSGSNDCLTPYLGRKNVPMSSPLSHTLYLEYNLCTYSVSEPVPPKLIETSTKTATQTFYKSPVIRVTRLGKF
jgi:hypothetical protein